MKVMDKSDISDQDMKEQIQEEIRIQCSMKHPNIAQVVDVFEDDCHLYVVIEHLLKGDLFDVLYNEHSDPMSEKEASEIFRDMIEGIAHLHANNIIHRDIKLENILMNEDGHVKIIDFGSAVDWLRCKDPEEFRVVCGTREYMAPEMLKEKTYDAKVDIWSCGVLLYELLHRNSPLKSDAYKNKHKVILKHILNDKVTYSKKLSNEVVDLMKKCMEHDPKKRISAAEILQHSWLNKDTNRKRVATYRPRISHVKHQWIHSDIIPTPLGTPLNTPTITTPPVTITTPTNANASIDQTPNITIVEQSSPNETHNDTTNNDNSVTLI
jgi:serine/threonine protein kinase